MTVETQVDGAATAKRKEQRESVVIRFAGDSGDGAAACSTPTLSCRVSTRSFRLMCTCLDARRVQNS